MCGHEEAVERVAASVGQSDDGRVRRVASHLDSGLRRQRVARHRIQLLARYAVLQPSEPTSSIQQLHRQTQKRTHTHAPI